MTPRMSPQVWRCPTYCWAANLLAAQAAMKRLDYEMCLVLKTRNTWCEMKVLREPQECQVHDQNKLDVVWSRDGKKNNATSSDSRQETNWSEMNLIQVSLYLLERNPIEIRIAHIISKSMRCLGAASSNEWSWFILGMTAQRYPWPSLCPASDVKADRFCERLEAS